MFPNILKSSEAHIWIVKLRASHQDFDKSWQVLTSSEKQHAEQFKFPHLQENFVLTRGALRLLLAHYTNIPERELGLRKNQYGKPYLLAGDVHFNVSHSKDLAIIAFNKEHPIGVDVEFIQRKPDYAAIARRFFSPIETAALLALPKKEQLKNFFILWTYKEAFIKAVGKGLSYNLSKFAIDLAKVYNQEKMLIKDQEALPKQTYALRTILVSAEYYAALATAESIATIQQFYYPFTPIIM